jgi:hypothetical protein
LLQWKGGPSVAQDFDIGLSNNYFFYPALSIDSLGNLDVVFGYSNSDILFPGYPSIAMTGQALGDPKNSWENIIYLKFSNSGSDHGCGIITQGNACRWGDYFGSAVDPSNPTVIWTAGEYFGYSKAFVFLSWCTSVTSMTTSPLSFGFSLTNPGGITTLQGSSGSATVTATLLSGAPQTVSLACTAGLPAGASCSFDPSSGTPNLFTSFSSTLKITTSSSTPPGSYLVKVTGTSADLSATSTTSVTLKVTTASAPTVLISLNPSSGSNAISSTNYFVVTSTLNGSPVTHNYAGGTLTFAADPSTTVTIAGKSSGSSANEEWCLNNACSATSFNSGSGTATTYYYYDLLTQTASLSIIDGGSPPTISLSYSTAPSSSSSTDSQLAASVRLTTTQGTLLALRGTTVSVPQSVCASICGEDWATPTASWTISSGNQISQPIKYYHQYLTSYEYTVSGGGSPSFPTVIYTAYGSSVQVTLSTVVSRWTDAGTTAVYTNPLGGSTTTERWQTSTSSFMISTFNVPINPTYYNQFLITFRYAVVDGGNPSAPSVSYRSLGSSSSILSSTSGIPEWADTGSPYNYANPLSGSPGERWFDTAPDYTGTSSSSISIDPSFTHQFLLTVNVNPTGAGSTSPSSEWVSSGARLSVQATSASNSGFAFLNWTCIGTGCYSGTANPTPSVTVMNPMTETANFQKIGEIIISSDTTLTNDLFCNDLTINAGITLTAAGHSISCTGTINNLGTIKTGIAPSRNFPNSFGGSGGGEQSSACNAASGSGYSTLVPGGRGANSGNAESGSTANAPALSNSLIQNWYNNGMSNYLAGAGGQPTCSTSYPGGAGAYGLYLQGNRIIAGTIIASGLSGSGTCSGVGLSGGGGGGVIVFAYGSGGYVPGTYTTKGGTGVPSCDGSVHSGNGGIGQILVYSYASPPIKTSGSPGSPASRGVSSAILTTIPISYSLIWSSLNSLCNNGMNASFCLIESHYYNQKINSPVIVAEIV